MYRMKFWIDFGLGLGLCSHPGLRSNILFLREMSDCNWEKVIAITSTNCYYNCVTILNYYKYTSNCYEYIYASDIPKYDCIFSSIWKKRRQINGIVKFHINSFQFVFVRTSLDYPGLSLVFVEIMPDKVILDDKKSYLVYFVQFWKFSFFSILSKNCPSEKIKKNENFQNTPNMTFYGLKRLDLA